MSSLAGKARLKALQDKFQAILSSLLKDDDNKYCVDCDAKGPRWASWNLGIFLCIRCAGIHRNLGVHITKVKSVNLDTWTPEQIVMMQEVGNSRARAAYEANLPDGFRRPQSDLTALESFVRAKYEHKKYMAREWIVPKPTVPKEWLEDEKPKKRSKPKSTITLSAVPKAEPQADNKKSVQDRPQARTATTTTTSPKESSNIADLIGLDTSSPTSQSKGGDLLVDIFGNQPAATSGDQNTAQSTPGQDLNGSEGPSLFDTASGETTDQGQASGKSTKESILALYGNSAASQQQQQQQQQKVYGVPGGMYMPQQQQQQGSAVYGAGMPVQMAGMQYPQGMMGVPQAAMYGMGMPQQMGANMMGYQQQQLQFQQMQQQMAAMQVAPAAGQQNVSGGWSQSTSGQTLSTNLWQ